MRIQDKVIVITGGASGLGLATAQFMAKEKGARIAIFDMNAEAGAQAVVGLVFVPVSKFVIFADIFPVFEKQAGHNFFFIGKRLAGSGAEVGPSFNLPAFFAYGCHKEGQGTGLSVFFNLIAKQG